MKISEVQFTPIPPRGGLVGFASFVYDNAFKITSIGVHTTLTGGIRLVFPGNKFGSYVFPLTKEITGIINVEVLKKYMEVVEKQMEEVSDEGNQGNTSR